jgi:hypothetical protein
MPHVVGRAGQRALSLSLSFRYAMLWSKQAKSINRIIAYSPCVGLRLIAAVALSARAVALQGVRIDAILFKGERCPVRLAWFVCP